MRIQIIIDNRRCINFGIDKYSDGTKINIREFNDSKPTKKGVILDIQHFKKLKEIIYTIELSNNTYIPTISETVDIKSNIHLILETASNYIDIREYSLTDHQYIPTEKGIRINSKDYLNLKECIKSIDHELLHLNLYSNIDTENNIYGSTLYHAVCEYKNIVERLLENKIDIDSIDIKDNSSLIMAIKNKTKEMIKFLHNKNVNIKIEDYKKKETVLDHAAVCDKVKTTEIPFIRNYDLEELPKEQSSKNGNSGTISTAAKHVAERSIKYEEKIEGWYNIGPSGTP